MVLRTSLSRPVAVLAAAALALGAAGCGGGSDDGASGGGDGGSYASTWNEVCTSLQTAQTKLQSDGAELQESLRSPSQEELAKAFATPVSAFADAMTAALRRVEKLDAPEDLRAFQSKVSASAPETIRVLGRLRGPLAEGDIQEAQSVIARINPQNVFPAIPDRLKQQASACRVF